jgi:L-asparaginase II
MTSNPFFVAGSHSITTPLMDAFEGRILAKEGAEAFYAMAVFPPADPDESDPLFADGPIGIALKISDGSIARARDPVIIAVLEELGIAAAEKPSLRRYVSLPVHNVAGKHVGQVRSEFALKFT